MANHTLSLGKGAKTWLGRKKIVVYEQKGTSFGSSHDKGDHRLETILIRGVNYGHVLELTKADARELCFLLFDLTEDPKEEVKVPE